MLQKKLCFMVIFSQSKLKRKCCYIEKVSYKDLWGCIKFFLLVKLFNKVKLDFHLLLDCGSIIRDHHFSIKNRNKRTHLSCCVNSRQKEIKAIKFSLMLCSNGTQPFLTDALPVSIVCNYLWF